jgi:hypothetical protein
MHLKVIRDSSLSSSKGEYGKLYLDGTFFCFTCEQRWNDNKIGSSCIPVGSYKLLPYDSPAHGVTVVFHNPLLNIFGTQSLIPRGTKGRSLCEIHNANWPFQLKGCIAVGKGLTDITPNGLGVTNSVATFRELISELGNREGHTAELGSE